MDNYTKYLKEEDERYDMIVRDNMTLGDYYETCIYIKQEGMYCPYCNKHNDVYMNMYSKWIEGIWVCRECNNGLELLDESVKKFSGKL